MKRTTLVTIVAFFFVACVTDTEPTEPTAEESASKSEIAEAVDTGKADWSWDHCERFGWYGDGECDWFCPKRDSDRAPDPLFDDMQVDAGPTKYPILLAHGFNASPEFLGFEGVEQALHEDGHQVFVTAVPPYESAEVRGDHLARQIDEILEATGAEKVNIIAHSMGGLDTRYVISGLGYGGVVSSVTTISTPHRGSRVADVILGLTREVADEALNALAKFLGEHFSDLAEFPRLRAALSSLAETNADEFNQQYPDDPDVYYQSWAGVSNVLGIANPLDRVACGDQFINNDGHYDKMSGLLVGMAGFVAHGAELRPNDGMVTVASAQWGTFRGCVPADHADEIGAFRQAGPDPHTGFDHIRFARWIAFDLAALGH